MDDAIAVDLEDELAYTARRRISLTFGNDMHKMKTMTTCALLATLGCQSNDKIEGRMLWGNSFGEPSTKMVCILKAYRTTTGMCYEKDFEMLKKTEQKNLAVTGFVWEIVLPQEHQGKALSSHFDGALASGDPFRAFSFKKTYAITAPEKAIGDTNFRLCF